MIKTVGEILEIVKVATGKTEQDIALEVGYNRSYINSIKKKAATEHDIAAFLMTKYNSEIKQFVGLLQELLINVSPNSIGKVTLPQPTPEQTFAIQQATLKAIERLEQKFDSAFSEESGKNLEKEVGKKVRKGNKAKIDK